jgi:ribonuclease R
MNHREIEGGEEAREIAGYSSRRERMIMEAERRVLDAYKALFMRDHVGEILQGVVYQASPKGFVVQLNDHPIWCHHEVEFIPYEFSYHEDLFAWISDRTRQRIGLGSAVEVEVLNADVAAGRVEVALTAWRG